MMNDSGRSMFENMMPDMRPSPEEMETARLAALFEKNVRVSDYKAAVFDMSVAKDVKDYTDLMLELLVGVQKRTHVIWGKDRQFVNGDKPRWIWYVEWSQYELDVKPVRPINASET